MRSTDDPHGRTRGGRRAPAPPRPHEVRRLRGAPLRRLHRQARQAGRATPVHLQPGARRDPAGVPPGPRAQKQPGDERRRPAAQGGADLQEAARERLRLWDIRPRTSPARATGKAPAPSTSTPTSAAMSWRRTRPGHAGDAGGHALRHRRPLAPLGAGRHLRIRPPRSASAWRPTITVPYRPGQDLERHGHLHLADRRGEDAHGQGPHRGRQPGGGLKPDMFADVFLAWTWGGLVVPGQRRDRRRGPAPRVPRPSRGRFEPREVSSASSPGADSRSCRGLAEGDRVVTAANFLLDSESSLRAALSAMAAPETSAPPPAQSQTSTEGRAMIRAIIRFSAHNRFLVLLATAVRRGLRDLHPPAHPARRHPRPLRHAGHHLLALGPQPGHHRGPGHLPDRHRPARARRRSRPSAASPTSASPTSTSSSRTAPTSTGRAAACSSTCPRSSRGCPQGVKTELGPDATGVGWVFQYALVDDTGDALARRAAHVPGLVPALPAPGVPGVAEVASIGGFVKQYQVTVDPNRLGLRPRHHGRGRGHAHEQQRGRRPAGRVRRRGVHGPRPRLRPSRWRTSRRSCSRRTSAARRSWCGTSATVALGPEIRRGVADLDGAGRRRRRHRRHAPRRERPQRHRARQGEARGDRAVAAEGRARSSPPTTARS